MKIFISILAILAVVSGVALAALVSPGYEGVKLSNGIVVGGPPGASKIGIAGGGGATYWTTAYGSLWAVAYGTKWTETYNTVVP